MYSNKMLPVALVITILGVSTTPIYASEKTDSSSPFPLLQSTNAVPGSEMSSTNEMTLSKPLIQTLITTYPNVEDEVVKESGKEVSSEGMKRIGSSFAASRLFIFEARNLVDVRLPNTTDIQIGPQQNFSLSAWIYPKPDMSKEVYSIMSKRTCPGHVKSGEEAKSDHIKGHGIELSIFWKRLNLQLGTGSDFYNYYGGPELIRPAQSGDEGKLVHVAATVDRASPQGLKLYIEGKLVHTADPTRYKDVDLTVSEPFLIGTHANIEDYQFVGSIHGPSYFPFVLTSETIEKTCARIRSEQVGSVAGR